ncbi:hypothetical protein ACOSQ4_024943 [Xanthoceras sorbifolium]
MLAVCPFGCGKVESSLHAVWGCKILKPFREACGIVAGLSGFQQLSFLDFLVLSRAQLLMEELELFCMLLWHFWHLRNRFVHGKQLLDVAEVVDWSRSFLRDFQAAAITLSAATSQDKKARC